MNLGVEAGRLLVSQPGKCEIVAEKSASDTAEDQFQVKLLKAENGKLVAPPAQASQYPAFTMKLGAGPAQQVPAGSIPPAPLKAMSMAGAAVTLLAADDTQICAGKIPAAEEAGQERRFTETVLNTALNQRARSILEREKVVANRPSRDALERSVTIHHLPNGSPAFALPAHVTEHDLVALEIVLPEGASARADVTACGARADFRILGGNLPAAAKVAGFQAEHKDLSQERQLSRIVFPQTLQCSDSIKYTLSVFDPGSSPTPTATSDVTLPIDPVYTFSVGVASGYDMAAPVGYSLRDLPDASSGSGTSKFINRSKAQEGLRTIITATYHPFQFNPNDWHWTNLVAPFVGINPASPLNGAVVGNEFVLPSGLFGILAGVSIFQSDELPSQLALSAGDKWTTTGDLPRNSTYGHSFGAFLGVNLNAIAVARLFAK
ncbi:MAG TPA: hypothetical protein VI356_15720 [Myxococcales bacterium]